MFITVFSIFVAAVLVLSFLTVRWALRRDRERRTADPVAPGDAP